MSILHCDATFSHGMRPCDKSKPCLPCITSHPVLSSFLKNKLARRFAQNAWSDAVGPYRGSFSPTASKEDDRGLLLVKSALQEGPEWADSSLPLAPPAGGGGLPPIVLKAEQGGGQGYVSYPDRVLHELTTQETARREMLNFEECHYFTKYVVAHLQRVSELMGLADDRQAAVRERKYREQDRKVMLDKIGNETTHRLARARAGKALRHKIAALLSDHLQGWKRIVSEEEEKLQELLVLEKESRPFGHGCFLPNTTKEDPRLRGVRLHRKGHRSRHSIIKGGQLTVRQESTQCSENVVSPAPSSNTGEFVLLSRKEYKKEMKEERMFEIEGLKMYRKDKLLKYAAIKRSRAFIDLDEEEQLARRAIHVQESEASIALLRLSVDGPYDAKYQTRLRKAREAAEEAKASEEAALHDRVKVRLATTQPDEIPQRQRSFGETRGKTIDGDKMLVEENEETVRSEAATAEIERIWQNFSDNEKRGGLILERQGSEPMSVGNTERSRTSVLSVVKGGPEEEELMRKISLSISQLSKSLPVFTTRTNDEVIIEWHSTTPEMGSFSISYLRKAHWKQDLLYMSLISQFSDHIAQLEAHYKEDATNLIRNMLRQRINILEDQIEDMWFLYCQSRLEKKAKH